MPDNNQGFNDILQSTLPGAINGGLGAIMGLFTAKANDRRQINQAQKLQQMQIAGSKELTDYNYAKQMQMWRDTNYPEQMKQLEAAGLNPALLYGMKGGGGITTGSGSGASAAPEGQAQQNPGEIQQMATFGLQMGLQQSQIELNKALAKQAESNATFRGGPETANVEADTVIKRINAGIQTVTRDIALHTQKDVEDMVSQAKAKLDEEVQQMGIKTNIDRATMNTVIDQATQNLAKTLLEKALIQAQTNKTGKESKILDKDIQYYYDKMMTTFNVQDATAYAAMNNTATYEHAQTQEGFDKLWNQMIHDVNDSDKVMMEGAKGVIQAMFLKGLLTPAGRTEVGGFHKR